MILQLTAALLALCAAPAKADRDSGSPNGAQELAYLDAEVIGERDRLRKRAYEASDKNYPYQPDAPYQRYFRVITPAGKDRDNFLVVFCAHLNKLSVKGKFKWPAFVAPDLLRIDVRDYGWDKNGVILVYEKTRDADPYFHRQAIVKEDTKIPVAWPGGRDGSKHYERSVYSQKFYKGDIVAQPDFALDSKKSDLLRRLVVSESPLLVAEWFFAQTCRQRDFYGENEPGIGYYDFLAIKDRDAFFELCGVDAKKAEKIARVWAAVVLDSGITQHNRQVFRLGAIGEFVWGTFDTARPKDKGVLQRNLRSGEFAHQAEEWFGRLPNGLDVTALFNDKGVRQATAPDNIVGGDKSKLARASDDKYDHNDLPIHANLSCVRCHGAQDLLKDVEDWARDTFRQGGPLYLTDPDKNVTLELEEQYLRPVNKLLKRDREAYSDAVKEVTTSRSNPEGWTCTKFAQEYSAALDRYAYERVTPESAAREIGVPKERLMKGIKAYASQYNRGQGDNVLTTWLVSDKGIKRTLWEQSYPLATALALGLSPPEEVKREKVLPKFESKKGK